jgi:hypothetical protein
MSYIRRCGWHYWNIPWWWIKHSIKFEIMDEIDYMAEIKIFDEVGFIINCIHVVYFIIHVINFVHLIICIHITHLH